MRVARSFATADRNQANANRGTILLFHFGTSSRSTRRCWLASRTHLRNAENASRAFRSSSFVVPLARALYFSTSNCRVSIAHSANTESLVFSTKTLVSARASFSLRSADSSLARHSLASVSNRNNATACARSCQDKPLEFGVVFVSETCPETPARGAGASEIPFPFRPGPESLRAALDDGFRGGVAGRAPALGGDAGGVRAFVVSSTTARPSSTVPETGEPWEPAADSAARSLARIKSSCADNATMAVSLARLGVCDASFLKSNASGARGELPTRSATGVDRSVARVAGETVSTTRGREDEAFVGPSDDMCTSLGVAPRPLAGLLGGVPDAEGGRPRRGDPWGDGIASAPSRVSGDSASRRSATVGRSQTQLLQKERSLGAGASVGFLFAPDETDDNSFLHDASHD